jgi:hypothetical protein
MALNIKDDNTIEVISSKDEAVGCQPDAYSKYLETLDESLLDLDPVLTPTRFVLRTSLKYDESKAIKNQQLGYKMNGEMSILTGFMMDVIRTCLIDIKGAGTGIEFKKDSDGKASKELVGKLDQYGIMQELFIARQNSLETGTSKKSLRLSSNSPSPTTQL